MTEYDYIIVGAGSAGCTLAYRLGSDPSLKILVLEAGGKDRSPLIKMPLTWGLILKHRLYDWGYETEPEPRMNGRRIECARGKVLGGSSSINGMAYARGVPEDYDFWARDLGLKGWSYADVLPYFKRSESWADGATALRGGDGPLNVDRLAFDDPLLDAFLASTDALGYQRVDDYNSGDVFGFGPMQVTIRNGKRWSAASAYLRPAVARGNVTVQTGTLVTRVLLEHGRAVGVEVDTPHQKLFVRREVLLAGGVFNSPQLLMLSGIGPAASLAKLGIRTAIDLPGVGENLQDHIACDVRWARREPGPLHRALRLDRLTGELLRNWCLGDGMFSKIPAAAVGLIHTDQSLDLPDVQVILAAAPMTAGPHLGPFLKPYADSYSIKGVFLTPESRGRICLSSSNPSTPPSIHQNFLKSPEDALSVRRMIQRVREIGSQDALAALRGEELAPGSHVLSNADLDGFIRSTAITLHHPVGTCKMGAENDRLAVLNEKMQVRGVQNLRVIDGSAIPRTVRGPTNAPIIMMAEKASDDVLQNAKNYNPLGNT